jgi:type I restriction enzyme M protein
MAVDVLDMREDAELRAAKEGMRPVVVELLHTLRGGGLPNPMLAAEQLALLLLLRYLGGSSWLRLKHSGKSQFALSRDELPVLLRQPLRVGGRALHEALRNATFAFPSQELFDLVVQRLDDLPAYEWVCADLLDAALDEVSATSSVGSPRTPATVSGCMIALTEPRPDDRVLDPAAGAGDRLLAVIRKSAGVGPGAWARAGTRTRAGIDQVQVHGVDLDATMVRLGVMSLVFHGVDEPNIRVDNVLANPPDQPFDVILCQPPFGNRIDPAMLAPEFRELPTPRSELLFAELTLNRLSRHGRAAIVLPVNVTFSKVAGAVRLRRRLLDRLRAVIALPQGTFQPHTNVETVLLAVGEPTGHVVFVDARDAERGQSAQSTELLMRSAAIVDDLLGDLLNEGLPPEEVVPGEFLDRVFMVGKEEIEASDCSLSSSTYRPARETGEVPDSPLALFGEIERTESEISHHLAVLGQRLAERAARNG